MTISRQFHIFSQLKKFHFHLAINTTGMASGRGEDDPPFLYFCHFETFIIIIICHFYNMFQDANAADREI